MPCVLKTCSHDDVVYVLTCSRTCQCVLRVSALTCLRALCVTMLTCQCPLFGYVLLQITWENVYWYQSYTQNFLSCFFSFTSFNTTGQILLVKIILIRNWKSVKCKQFSSANACVQIGSRYRPGLKVIPFHN